MMQRSCAKFRGAWTPATALAIALAVSVILLAGCGREEVIIPAEPAERGGTDLGLGAGIMPLTTGPGDKSSPRWSPSGERISFTVDGYVVDKSADAHFLRRRTTRDFGAQEAEWVSQDGGLAILGADLSASSSAAPIDGEIPRAVYRTHPEHGDLSVDEVATGVLAMATLPNNDLVIALEETGSKSAIAVMDSGSGEISRRYPGAVEGVVSGLSASPDGNKLALAARREDSGGFEIRTFDLGDGTSRLRSILPNGEEILGAPQWTTRGFFYVAGEVDADEDTPPFGLYRVPLDSGDTDPVPGVGEDFVASSLRASPDGERLAIIGRRSPNLPADLYVLDLVSETLEAVTANENMEIKTGPDDLDWSSDGGHIAIVARGILSGSRVYPARAEALLTDFFNVYDVPVEDQIGARAYSKQAANR